MTTNLQPTGLCHICNKPVKGTFLFCYDCNNTIKAKNLVNTFIDVQLSKKYPVITICGSMSFIEIMFYVACRLTSNGYIVLMPFMAISPDKQETSETKKMLDDMHFRKIDMSSEIFVIDANKDEYACIGESTKREIEYALSKGIKVTYYSLSDYSK